MTDKDQLREGVIDAARALVPYLKNNHSVTSQAPACQKLIATIRALDAPTSFKPEEVEPGKTFRFLLDDGELSGLCRARQMEGSGWPIYEHLEHGPKHMVYRFERGDKIIPIEGEEE